MFYYFAQRQATLKTALYLLCYFSQSLAAHADTEWALRGNLHQLMSYDDNLRMSRTTPQGAWLYVAMPEFVLAHHSEQFLLETSASYGIQRYFGVAELNAQIQNYALKGSYKTEKISWNLAANLNITPSRSSAAQDSGNFAINSQKIQQSLQPSFVYQFSSQDNAHFDFQYLNTDYSATNFTDNRSLAATSLWNHQWTTDFSNGFSIGFTHFEFNPRTPRIVRRNRKTDIIAFDNYQFLFSGNYAISEHWRIIGAAGARFTRNQQNTATTPKWESDLLFNSDISYQGDDFSAHIMTDRALIPSSLALLQQQTEFKVQLNYNLSKTLSFGLLSSYQQNALQNKLQSQRDILTIQPSCRWQLVEDWTFALSYRYRNLKNNAAVDSADSNTVMLAIDYRWNGLTF